MMWIGEPTNAEPEKCAKVAWFRLDDLPRDMVGYAAAAIEGYRRGEQVVI